MSQEKSEEPWPKIRQEERILHEILFYSQGPLDGHLLGEDVRDLLLTSGLPLTVLSQIWNLADVTKDNVLNVHEFVLIMHLIRAAKSGRPVPGTLPRSLTPPDTAQSTPPPMTEKERDSYLQLFNKLDISRNGLIDANVAAEVFLTSQLPTEVLAQIWDLSDYGRDGKLSCEEFAIACHLLRYVKQGGSLDGPVDIFQYAPDGLSQTSLLTSKRRVLEYEEHKQRLIMLKERRKAQSSREIRRLDLCKEKVECLEELFGQLKKHGKEAEADSLLSKMIIRDKADIENQEEIVFRLKKVHEEVRQQTVKIILGEQKFNDDISRIKKGTDELNKRLLSIHTYDTKEEDPFHQMLEERKEKRQGSAIKDLDKIDVHLPFKFSPFDLEVTPETLASGIKIINKGSNHKQSLGGVKSLIADLKEFGEEFMQMWGGTVPATSDNMKEDEIFVEIHDWADVNWPECDWSQGTILGLADAQVARLIHKLYDIKEEMRKLNSEEGRLVFRNSEDYNVRKKTLAEERKTDEGRAQRRYSTDRVRSSSTDRSRMREATERYSYSRDRVISTGRGDVNQAKRELKLKRQSLNIDSSSYSLEFTENPNQRRKLQRSTTDPRSQLEQLSVSSSFDQAYFNQGTLEKQQEKPLSSKKQSSSRKDNSSVLTLRSSRRKDDLSLELASTALGRTIQVEAVPPPVSYEIAEHHEQVSCVSSTSKQEEKKTSTPRPADLTEANVVTKKYSSTNTSSLSPVANLLDPVHDKVTKHYANLVRLDDHVESGPLSPLCNKEDLQIKESVTTHISIEETVHPRSLLLDKKSEITKSPTDTLEAARAPQRPPRLKKENITSSTSKELLSPVCPSHSVDESNNNNSTYDKCLVGIEVPESTSLSNGVGKADTQASKTKYVARKQNVIIPKDNSCAEYSSNDSHEIPRDVSNLLSFFRQNSSDVNTRKELKNKQNEAEYTSVVAAVTLKKDLEDVGKSEGEFLEKCRDKPDRMIRKVKTPDLFSVPGSPERRNEGTFHVSAEVKSGKAKKNNFTQNHHPDCDEVNTPPPFPTSLPPPLPTSPPPPLPTSPPPICPTIVPPATKDNQGESGEELIMVEYTVPVPVSSLSQNVNHFSELHSSAKSGRSAKVSSVAVLSPTSSKLTFVVPSEVSKHFEHGKEYPSFQAASDMRAHFPVFTPLDSHKDVFDHDSTESENKSHQMFDSSVPVKGYSSGNYGDQGGNIVSSEVKSIPLRDKTLCLTSSPQNDASLKSAPQHRQNIVDESRRLSQTGQSNQTLEIKTEEQARAGGFHKDKLFEKRKHHTTFSKSKVNYKNSLDLSRLTGTDEEISEESVQISESVHITENSLKSSNTSDYGFDYSSDHSQPPPEAGWSDKQDSEQTISLYGESILKEGDTTESVDRESIANLSSTKKQWEVLLTTHNSGQEETSVKKKTAPKWEVRVPYTEKHPSASTSQDNQNSEVADSENSVSNKEDPVMFKKKVDNESAIEREIRLAFERELVLKVEEENRQKQKQKSQGQTIIASYEAESESFQPVYNELAEADRGSDLWRLENRRTNEDKEDEGDENDGDKKSNESIIEREIRLQREREAEVIKMRKESTSTQQLHQQQQQQHHQVISHEQHTQHEVKNVSDNQTKTVSYEDAISKSSHEGESLIARELREVREREEELKKLHSSIRGTHITHDADQSTQISPPDQKAKVVPANSQRSSQVEPPSGQGLWQRNVSPFVSQQRRESLDSTSSHGSGLAPSESIPSRRDVQVRPIADGHSDDEDKKPNYFEKQETPIEREMRLAIERENELRKQKGLPELDRKDDNAYDSYGASHESSNSTSVSRPRLVGQPSGSMKKFAASRLQQEVLQQKEREHELRSQGKIISTSEDHIELKKYMEVAGVDQVDGTEKRNFITKKTSVSYSEPDAALAQQAAASGGQRSRKTSAAGGNMFSYKEFKQNAESKIERELREMREREEELRMRRTSYQPENSQ